MSEIKIGDFPAPVQINSEIKSIVLSADTVHQVNDKIKQYFESLPNYWPPEFFTFVVSIQSVSDFSNESMCHLLIIYRIDIYKKPPENV